MIWQKVNEKRFDDFFSFLMSQELAAVALLNRLYFSCKKSEEFVMPLRKNGQLAAAYENDSICAAAFISRNGLLLPVFARTPEADDAGGLLDFARLIRANITTIMGMKENVDIFSKILQSVVDNKMEYYYMVKDYRKVSLSRPANNGICIRQCSVKDCDELFDLHKEYELEEVLLDPSTFRADFSYIYLKHVLEKEIVYMLKYKDIVISKCNSNARSPHYMQVGGMYTKPAYRNKGYGSMVLSKLMQHAAGLKKHLCLFVKKENQTALALYQKTGFSQNGEYEIVYL